MFNSNTLNMVVFKKKKMGIKLAPLHLCRLTSSEYSERFHGQKGNNILAIKNVVCIVSKGKNNFLLRQDDI